MGYSVYETISSSQSFPVRLFATPIKNSTFHWHNEYEMFGVLKGEVGIRVESESVTLRQGGVLLLNPRVIHAIQSMDDEKNLCMILQMSPSLFEAQEHEDCDIRFYLDSTRADEAPECGYGHFYKKLAELVYETVREDRHAAFRIRAGVCVLIADLFDYVAYDRCFQDPVAQNQQELAVSVIDYLDQHLTDDKALESVCRQFGLSRKTLDRLLKGMTGFTAKEMMETLRVEHAKTLLKNTEKNMNYVLDSCGFGSEKTFYRVFHQKTGLTPNEFRRKGQVEAKDETVQGYLDYEVSEVKECLEKVLA